MNKYLIISLLLLCNLISAQEILTFTSEIIPYTDTTLVFIPEDYNPAVSYPLVFLLHGWDGDYSQWDGITGGLQKIADQYGFIICCPDGFNDSWYIDSPVKSNSQFEKFFFSILVPSVQKKYKVHSENIFITGLSMGGHGALSLFAKHPDFFNSAASTSGILDLTEFPDSWGISNFLGSFQSNQERWKKNTVYYLIEDLKDKNKEILFDCGTEDFAYKVNQKTYLRCRELNIKAAFLSQPGTHNREYWKKSLPYHLEFFRMHLKK